MIARKTTDGPFFWASKPATQMVRQHCSESEAQACHARSVYLALCEIASDEGSETFATSKGLLAYRAGLSAKTVQRTLPDLERAGVVKIVRSESRLKMPSTYTLLAVAAKGPVDPTKGLPVPTMGLPVPTMGLEPHALQSPLYKEKKELKELGGAEKNPKTAPVRARDPIIDTLVTIDGSDIAQVTSAAFGPAAKAKKEIREVCPGVTADEIRRRASNYQAHFPGVSISANALSKHWAKCDRGPTAPAKHQDPVRSRPAFSANEHS